MPATATMAPATPAKSSAAPTLLVPFTRAAKEHLETFIDVSQIITANTQQLGPYDVPAYGFIRGIDLLIEATGGVASVTVAKQEDAPWSAIQEVALLDVNGAPIVGPLSGYDLYLINKYGGYKYQDDPKNLTGVFSDVAVGASASGNFAFVLRIPVELGPRDGLGSLANQNASSTYKLRLSLAPSAQIYSTAPNTTLPTVRVRGTLDAWTQPPGTDLRGNAQATEPPAHGTTGYWSKTVVNLATGFQTVRLPRVGNYLRELIFVCRDTSNGTRATGQTDFPDPASLYWDTRLLKQWIRKEFTTDMIRRFGYLGAAEAANGLDNGVFVEDYAHDFDGGVGFELRDGWLPTVQSTRLELTGTFAAATALTILTNDVSPAGEVFV